MKTTMMRWVALVALVVCMPVSWAQSPPMARTKCGDAATARWVGDAKDTALSEAQAAGLYVDHEGFWRVCQPWIKKGDDPYMSEAEAAARVPGAGCPQLPPPIHWKAGELVCTSYLAAPELDSGRKVAVLAEVGPARGMAVMQCQDGRWSVYGSNCALAQRCDQRVTVFFGPANRYSVVIDGASNPVNAGGQLQGLPVAGAHGLVATAQCLGGNWAVTGTRRVAGQAKAASAAR